MPKTEVDGVNLVYEIHGAGDPIVLAHGFSASRALFRSQVQILSKEYQVIVYDQRGHGESDKPEGEYSPFVFAADLDALLEKLRIKRTVVLGHSMGSMMAQVFALTYPERLRGLILYGAVSNMKPLGNVCGPWAQDAIKEIEEKGFRTHLRSLIPYWFSSKTDRRRIESWLHEAFFEIPAYVAKGVWKGNMKFDVVDRLEEIKAPTLIIVGGDDCRTPVENSELLNRKIPNASLKIIRDAAHLANLEKPEEFNQALLNFLRTL